MCTSNYTVSGMTCGHCAQSVTEQVRAIPGVSDLSIDLATGSLSVTSASGCIAEAAVRDAVVGAGYTLVSA